MSAILIVGGSRGYGRGITRAFAKRGHAITVVARGQEALNETVQEAKRAGAKALAMSADVCQSDTIRKAIVQAVEQFGEIDVVAYCAGADSTMGRFPQLSLDTFRTNYEVDVFGGFNTFQLVLPHMRKPGGRLVMISSLAAISNSAFIAGFASAKAAQIAMAVTLNTEVNADGLSVQCLCPEISVEGNIGRRAFGKFAELYGISEEAARQQAIIQPMVTAADVGEAAVEVCSGEKPAGVWRVSGTGLSPIDWVPRDFAARSAAASS